jgi:hypothetical protein
MDINFDYYYHLIDPDHWRVENNLLKIKMKPELLVLKDDEFIQFARFAINDNSLVLIDALDNDFWVMNHEDIAKKLYKK